MIFEIPHTNWNSWWNAFHIKGIVRNLSHYIHCLQSMCVYIPLRNLFASSIEFFFVTLLDCSVCPIDSVRSFYNKIRLTPKQSKCLTTLNTVDIIFTCSVDHDPLIGFNMKNKRKEHERTYKFTYAFVDVKLCEFHFDSNVSAYPHHLRTEWFNPIWVMMILFSCTAMRENGSTRRNM